MSLFKVGPALPGVGEETLRKGGEGMRVESNRRHPFLPINPASGSQLDFYPLFILDAHVTCSRGSNLLLDVKQIFLEPLGT